MLLFTAAVHPQWKVQGDGWASPRQNCGCREVTSACEYKGGDFGEFWDNAYCRVYNSARWMYVINAVLIAWVTSTTFAIGIPNTKSAWFMSNLALLGLFTVCGLVQILLMIKLPESSNGGGLTDLLYGFQVGVSGWVFGAIVFIMMTIMTTDKETERMLKAPLVVNMAKTALLISVIMFTSGFAHFKWKTILVREDRILISDFTTMMEDMHANIGVPIEDTTILSNNAPLILNPNCCKGTEANTDFELGLWNFCLCKNIKAGCKWSNATILSGSDCKVLETSQVFLWITPWASVIALLWTAYDPEDEVFTVYILTPLVFVAGMVTTISYSALYDNEGMHGAGFIMYISGFVSVVIGVLMRYFPKTSAPVWSDLPEQTEMGSY